ncbi:hypothetical protein Tco_0309541 [Tanacetum coccineum]
MEVQAVDEAFVMANYSRLEPRMRRRMRELRLQGVATRLNYSSEDVDEEREMEAPPGFQPRPSDMTEEPILGNIPSLLASHPRETERRRMTLSPREAVGVDRNPPNNIYPPNNVYPPNNNSQKTTTDSWTKYTHGYKQKKRLSKADLLSSWTTTQERSSKKEDHRKGQEGRIKKDETCTVPTKNLPSNPTEPHQNSQRNLGLRESSKNFYKASQDAI